MEIGLNNAHSKMREASLASWHGPLSVLVAMMPFWFAVSWRAKAVPATLLLVAGAILLLGRAATRQSFREARWVLMACALALLYPALNILGHRLGWDAFDRPSHILLYMITAAVFSLPLRMRWVWRGFSLTAIVLGIVCIVQHGVLGVARAYGLNGGGWGAIEFAMFLLVLSLMALVQVLYGRGHRGDKLLHAGAVVLGVYGAMLTQSRGPLLAFVPVFLLMLLGYARRTGYWTRSLLLMGAMLAGVTVAALSLRGEMLDRFADVGTEMASYNHHTDATGAVRERIEMWRTAGRAVAAHPLAGLGIDQFGMFVRQQVAAGRANPAIDKYEHPHNEYLEAAATGGIPGLLVLLAVFAAPLAYFARHARSPDPDAMIAACAGMAVVGMYMLCALSDNVFYRAMPHSLYFFLVLGFAVLIGGKAAAMRGVRHG